MTKSSSFSYFCTDECSIRQCFNTVSSSSILDTLLEDKEVLVNSVKFSLIEGERRERLQRDLKCPPQEWPLLRFRMECIAHKIMSSNTSHIADEAVRLKFNMYFLSFFPSFFLSF